jgi:death on curing protein
LTIRTLTFEEIMHIHNVLVADFLGTPDPIEPSGIRDQGHLLHSAVTRQDAGFGHDKKYKDSLGSAATLCYGVCCNHAFHNGNKRTALVSLLCHLDKNGLMLKHEVTPEQLYQFMIDIASHKFAPRRPRADSSDVEVTEIVRWLHRNTRQIKKGERIVTFRELRQILRRFDIELENPQGNYIDVIRYRTKRTSLFGQKRRIGSRVANIPYPREGMEVGRNVLKSVRAACELTEEHGYDSEMFYSAQTSVDVFITRYKGTLRRLAKV